MWIINNEWMINADHAESIEAIDNQLVVEIVGNNCPVTVARYDSHSEAVKIVNKIQRALVVGNPTCNIAED